MVHVNSFWKVHDEGVAQGDVHDECSCLVPSCEFIPTIAPKLTVFSFENALYEDRPTLSSRHADDNKQSRMDGNSDEFQQACKAFERQYPDLPPDNNIGFNQHRSAMTTYREYKDTLPPNAYDSNGGGQLLWHYEPGVLDEFEEWLGECTTLNDPPPLPDSTLGAKNENPNSVECGFPSSSSSTVPESTPLQGSALATDNETHVDYMTCDLPSSTILESTPLPDSILATKMEADADPIVWELESATPKESTPQLAQAASASCKFPQAPAFGGPPTAPNTTSLTSGLEAGTSTPQEEKRSYTWKRCHGTFNDAEDFVNSPSEEMRMISPENDDLQVVEENRHDLCSQILQAMTAEHDGPPKGLSPAQQGYCLERYDGAIKDINTILNEMLIHENNRKTVEARIMLTVKAIVDLHKNGIPERMFHRGSKGYKPEADMTCSARADLVIKIVKKNLFIRLDILTGVSVIDIVRAPQRYLKRKLHNFKGNAKKAEALRSDKPNRGPKQYTWADPLVLGVGDEGFPGHAPKRRRRLTVRSSP